MAGEYNYQMPIIEATCEVNQRQRRAVVEKLQTALKLLRGQTIVVLGLAFKPDTDDVRESAAMDIVRILVERGAVVRAHDPIGLDNARAELDALGVESDGDVYRWPRARMLYCWRPSGRNMQRSTCAGGAGCEARCWWMRAISSAPKMSRSWTGLSRRRTLLTRAPSFFLGRLRAIGK